MQIVLLGIVCLSVMAYQLNTNKAQTRLAEMLVNHSELLNVHAELLAIRAGVEAMQLEELGEPEATAGGGNTGQHGHQHACSDHFAELDRRLAELETQVQELQGSELADDWPDHFRYCLSELARARNMLADPESAGVESSDHAGLLQRLSVAAFNASGVIDEAVRWERASQANLLDTIQAQALHAQTQLMVTCGCALLTALLLSVQMYRKLASRLS